MSKILKRIMLAMIIIAGIIAGYQSIQRSSMPVDSLLAFCNTDEAKSIVGWNEDDNTVIARIDQAGKIEKSYQFQTRQKDCNYRVRGIAAGGIYVYVLRDRTDSYDGTLLGQELVVLNFEKSFVKEEKTFDITNQDNYEYGWINSSGDTVTLIGTDPYETKAIWEIHEYGAILEETLSLKNTRTYPMKSGEGIYKAIGNSRNLVYISDSGKIYCASEEKVQEVYPARDVTTLMYPSYIAHAESGYIYLGEHETGDIIKLNLTDGSEETIWSGNSPFGGSSIYTPRNIVTICMANLNEYTALVKNPQTGMFSMLLAENGTAYVVDEFRYNTVFIVCEFFKIWVTYIILLLVAFFLITIFVSSIRGGHTIMERLISATIPMLVVTMALFGFISFQYYADAILQNFEKQTIDEGNMLAALFGQESFNEIEYPYDYSGEAYEYLSQQMNTRDLYTRALYYENGNLYIGVDRYQPCFYSYDILMNHNAESMYRRAALTGEAVTGTIRDALGERLICVTPIGGLSGETVYLLETGVYTPNIEAYTATFIKDFVIVCVAFLIIVMVVLIVLFYRILFPLGEMKREMQMFADGDRSIRINSTSEDELTGIARVFNKMADDIDMQILNLERMSKIYYRFVPPSIMELLGKDNLGDLTVGSSIKGDFAIMNIRLEPTEGISMDKKENIMNRFFTTVNYFSQRNEIVSVVDDANMHSMMLICKKGVDSAIVTALSILARIDAENKLSDPEEQLTVGIMLDLTEVYFGICGDKERYVPVILAPEFEEILSNEEFLGNMGSRFLVTETAYDEVVNQNAFANRYIGRMETENLEIGLYDIYDNSPEEQRRLLKQTQHAFDKAMDLFDKGFYYEAKNMFAMVVRENKQDMVAKYYIFRCEVLQNE
ncbi:MAG: HAMP domain-containing protein [Lachnospiraceae bacterium]|nr:HAMP domain-containing protein [Lachnospiraceae bacterium]